MPWAHSTHHTAHTTTTTTWLYSPSWALASCAIRLHKSLSWAFPLHPSIAITRRSSWTSSKHLTQHTLYIYIYIYTHTHNIMLFCFFLHSAFYWIHRQIPWRLKTTWSCKGQASPETWYMCSNLYGMITPQTKMSFFFTVWWSGCNRLV